MSGIFSKVAVKRPPYNNFSLSHDKKLSFQIGDLVPVLCTEVLPGDQFDIRSTAMVRFMPLVSPVMHRFDVYLHHFFVPWRIIWPKEGDNGGWESFITGGIDGEDTTVHPTVTLAVLGEGSTGDYLGIPPFADDANDLVVSAGPIKAYQKCFSDYFRDETQNTAQEFTPLTDGDNTAGNYYVTVPYNRCWQKDYFTSALPWTQRGPEATIPLGTAADLVRKTGEDPNQDLIFNRGSANPSFIERVNNSSFAADDVTFTASSGANETGNILVTGQQAQINITGHTTLDPTHFEVDLSTATAATINELRNAYRLQEFLEKNARGGARYVEIILSHFGVRSSDARLQRAEFLGGSKNPVQISEVLQTSATSSEPTPQGNMAGHGISVGGNRRISYRAEEHGFFLTLLSVMPKPAYQQGVHKMFLRNDKLDYYWPSFAHLGEQPILNKELYWDSAESPSLNDDIFGYTPRYAEYKYHPSQVAGQFRSSLDYWHAGRIFATRPSLNNTFLRCDSTEVDRIFAVTTAADHKMWAHVFHDFRARRPMPYFGTPMT